jgi:hypothetical protein
MDNKITNELNEENIINSDLFQELMDSIDSGKNIPYIEKNKVLMAPGIWNDCFYSKDEIIKAYENTDWKDRYNSNLILDHVDQKFSDWIGNVENRRLDKETGYVYGDLYIYDPITAIKLNKGKPKTGISPKVTGNFNEKEKKMIDFTFENFSIVINPAVKKAYMYNASGNKPVFFSDGGVSMTEEEKNAQTGNEVGKTETPAELSEIEKFTKFYSEFVTKNKDATLSDVYAEYSKLNAEGEEDKEEEEKEQKQEEPKKEEDEEEEKMSESKQDKEMNKTIKEMAQTIKELSEKVKTLEAPEKVTKSGVVAEMSQSQDSDEQMLSFLKGM